jgi:molybdate transport system substrate-binding protein
MVLAVAVLSLWGATCAPSSSPPPSPQKTGRLSVAAAADLTFVLEEINEEFARSNPGIEVNVTYGSSGNFFTQLSNKAPFDLFLSADMDYPRKLVGRKLAREDTLFQYGVGRIVLWAPKDSPVDVARLGIAALLDPRVRKIAVANPRHAPYGRAAEASLRSLGVYDRVKDKLVLGENVAQAAQYVESGAADIGVIALPLAEAPALKNKGRSWEVPLDSYPRMDQGGVILSWARDERAARAYREFLLSDRGREILGRYGFSMPEKRER